MSVQSVVPVWQTIQTRFARMVQGLPEADLDIVVGSSTIRSMIRHTAEVEFMFVEWFFGVPIPADRKEAMEQAKQADAPLLNVEELSALLAASSDHLIAAMHGLTDEAWNTPVESPMGPSTPFEAVGRLMYHTGIHAGQISLSQKLTKNPS